MKPLFRAGASVEKIIRVAPVPPTAGFDPFAGRSGNRLGLPAASIARLVGVELRVPDRFK